MTTSVAGISFDLSLDGSKMFASINASCKKVKDQFDKSFSQAAKKSTKAIETGNQEIDKILNNTARTAKKRIVSLFDATGEIAKLSGDFSVALADMIAMAKAAAEMSGGDTEKLLKELIDLIKDLPIVTLDPETLRKYFIEKTNQNTKSRGKSELVY